jgi:hypothetical protein
MSAKVFKSLRVLFPAPWGEKKINLFRLNTPLSRETRKSTNGRGLAPGMFIKAGYDLKVTTLLLKRA